MGRRGRLQDGAQLPCSVHRRQRVHATALGDRGSQVVYARWGATRDQFQEPEGHARRRHLSRRTITGGLLSALLFLHNGLFRAGLLIPVITAIWGLVIYFRKLPPGGGFRSTLGVNWGLV